MSSEWSLAHSEEQGEYDSSFGSHRSFDGEGGGGWASWQQLGDDESFADSEQRNRDAVDFLLDATSPMLGLNAAGEQHWSNAVQLIAQFIAKKVVASPDDLIGVCLVGTRRLQVNNNSFPHVHKYVPLSNPSAAMITAVRRLQTGEAQAEIGMGEEGDVEMFNALWCCQSMFTESNIAGGGGGGGGQHRGGSRQSLSRTNRRIMVWTTNDRPYNANDPVSRRQALQKAADLREQETEIQLFPLIRPDHKFNIFLFWKVRSQFRSCTPQTGHRSRCTASHTRCLCLPARTSSSSLMTSHRTTWIECSRTVSQSVTAATTRPSGSQPYSAEAERVACVSLLCLLIGAARGDVPQGVQEARPGLHLPAAGQ
jgi:hypothetical protein